MISPDGGSVEYADDALTELLRDQLKKEQNKTGDLLRGPTKTAEHEIPATILAHRDVRVLLVTDPDRLMRCLGDAIKLVLSVGRRLPKDYRSIARLTRYPCTDRIRGLGGERIGKMVCVRGMVSHVAQPTEVPIRAVYRCPDGHPTISHGGDEPNICSDPDCKHRNPEPSETESVWGRAQEITIQELPQDMQKGDNPAALWCVVDGSSVERIRPGSVVAAVGILRATKKGPRDRARVRRLQVNNLEILTNVDEANGPDPDGETYNPKREAELKKLARPGILRKLAGTLAPHIAGYDQIKEALVLAMVSSPMPHLDSTRWNLNVLLVGDPSTAKTQLLLAVRDMDARTYYASGKGSSGVGLTAAVLQDAAGGYVLNTGPIIHADLGVICIDELDKIGYDDRSGLHEVSESQRLTINKAGVHAVMLARVSIIAAANPKEAVYNPNLTVADNINLGATLLSRFDLVYILRDVPNRKRDGEVVDAMFRRASGSSRGPLDRETAAEYIELAKRVQPVIHSEVRKIVKQYFLDARQSYGEHSIPIALRQVQSILRIAVAKAKIEMRNEANESDARYAIDMVSRMLDGAARDPVTGKIDANILQGTSALDRTRLKLTRLAVSSSAKASGEATRSQVVQDMMETGKWPDKSSASAFLQRCIDEKHIVGGPGGLRLPSS